MKVLEIFSSIVSIASGLISILSVIGIARATEDTKLLTIHSETLWIALGASAFVFVISLLANKKAITAIVTLIKSQFQFGGKNNSQNMR